MRARAREPQRARGWGMERADAEAEDRVRELAAVGLLTELVTEQLASPLFGAIECVAALKSDALGPARTAQYAEALADALERMREVVLALRRRAQGGQPSPQAVPVGVIARRSLSLAVGAAASVNARIVPVIAASRARAWVDPDDAVHAILHLVSGGLGATPAGTCLQFEAHTQGGRAVFSLSPRRGAWPDGALETPSARLCLEAASRLVERNGGGVEVREESGRQLLALWLPLVTRGGRTKPAGAPEGDVPAEPG